MRNFAGKLNILLHCNLPPEGQNANTVLDHISAFKKYSKHNIYIFSNVGPYPDGLKLSKFDALILHYSSTLTDEFCVSKKTRNLIAKFPRLKILFIQDEYRKINSIRDEIRRLGIHVLFTCFPDESIEKIYPISLFPELKKINTLTGYVPSYLIEHHKKPINERTIDVGYRTRKVPFWLGSLGVEKWQIADEFLRHTAHANLKTDISYNEADRIYGSKWIDFVGNCKAMLGVESGASVMDFTGELQKTIDHYQMQNPQVTFEEISEKFLQGHEEKIYMNQISPRCFEAIALKTVLILFEGRYSNILKPHRHYIPLKKDFSNISEVLELIRDPVRLQKIADRAFQEIALNPIYSYADFIGKVDGVINHEFIRRNLTRIKQKPYSHDAFVKASKKFKFYFNFSKIFLPVFYKIWSKFPLPIKKIIKIIFKKMNIYNLILTR